MTVTIPPSDTTLVVTTSIANDETETTDPLLPPEEENAKEEGHDEDPEVTPEVHNVATTLATTAASSPRSFFQRFRRRRRRRRRSATPSRQRRSSLALATTTPCLAAVLLPLLTLAAHVLFYYGQTAPMWRLVAFQEYDIWVNATSTQSRWAFDTLGLHHTQHIYVDGENQETTVRTFTYGYALQELWRAKGMPGKFLPRLTAVLLVFCSGIWPHLKLFLLNLTFLFPMRSMIRRKRFLHWLSTLGKWSLADVLTVCVMVAVLRLEWDVDPAAIQSGVIHELPTLIPFVHDLYSATDLCTMLLKYDCAHVKKAKHAAKCRACRSLVNQAYTHPQWAKTTGKEVLRGVQTSGGGQARLSVIGMRGIYIFCLAVVLSILLSLIVDIFDGRARRETARRAALTRESSEAAAEPLLSDNTINAADAAANTAAPLELGPPSSHNATNSNSYTASDMAPPVSYIYHQPSFVKVWSRRLAATGTAVIVLLAAILPTMNRQATGAIPKLLNDVLGVHLERPYSFRTLMRTTGLAGGWDLLLMCTFSLFVVMGPVLRGSLCLLQSFSPQRYLPMFATAIDFIGAFCAWEVLVIAVVMVDMLMPTITDTIIMKPEQCGVVSPDGSCLKVEFDVLKSFAFVLAGGFALIAVSAFAVGAGRKVEAEQEAADSFVAQEEHAGHEYQQLLCQEDCEEAIASPENGEAV